MITLEDILSIATSDITIMDGIYAAMIINHDFDMWRYYDAQFLNKKVTKINAHGNRIRVWLEM